MRLKNGETIVIDDRRGKVTNIYPTTYNGRPAQLITIHFTPGNPRDPDRVQFYLEK